MKKVTTFCSGSSQVMKPWSALSTRNQVEEHAMEASVISCCKEIQDATISRQVNVDHLLGFSRAYPSDLPGMWNNFHKCSILCHASEKAEAYNTL
jgi:hypothetical protein